MNAVKLIATYFLLCFFSCAQTLAAGFDASVSPPNFELNAQPGQVIRQVINITNMAEETSIFAIHTEDWWFQENGEVKYHAGEPTAYSCRPWTRIERHKIRIPAKRDRPYRFEMHVPADAKPGACRFALIVGGDPDKPLTTNIAKNVSMPIVGRIGVIVYLTIGDAKPKMRLQQISMEPYDNKLIPLALFHNEGNAHARPSGVLEGVDATGKEVELWVSPIPVLPGQTRNIPLFPIEWSSGSAKELKATLHPPIKVKGVIEWQGDKLQLDRSIH